ncbi:high affinity immunoglobulin epsilon receptor subunit beta [Latimeria chalumnae]|uniref:high affinity immunoglobulin epsilon receptor subunit beta n=1 Tax=Latimeria chalumnae TaxID=7897 RepID=UPI0003C1A676|nr:PREDICTED: high affinity immunoglobulin epsilon receptor subunit beta-like [Latimeria chalumnae]|eukprot:XP_006002705.1 PREDICTED: high affinity immunoglobulin epsilon receptor subunit beta-like [Latimeria chalumnae]
MSLIAGSNSTTITPLPPSTQESTEEVNELTKRRQAFRDFLKVEPKALGVVLILLGIFQVMLGFPLKIIHASVMADIWTSISIGLLFLLSGILSVMSENDPKEQYVKACCVSNIVGAIVAVLGIIAYSMGLSYIRSIENDDEINEVDERYYYRYYVSKAEAIMGLVLAYSTAGLILQIVVSVFAYKGLQSSRCNQ